jgi:hypothetical protein
MKKLTYLVSAVLAGLGLSSTSANADVSVAGSATLGYTAAGSETALHTYGSVSFGLSTTTASGMAISTGAGITATISSAAGAGGGGANADAVARNVTGWDGLTFATSGATIEIGTDVALADGVGDVSGVAGDLADVGRATVDASVGVGSDEGAGIGLSTTFGGASLSLAYVMDTSVDGDTVSDLDDATATGSSVSISTSVGDVAVTAAYVTQNDANSDDTEAAISASYATGAGTVSVGYGNSTGGTDGSIASVAYSMSLDADTSIAIGYATIDQGANDSTQTEVALSRSLGGGASVFAEYVNVGGDTTGAETSAIAIGTSVSF